MRRKYIGGNWVGHLAILYEDIYDSVGNSWGKNTIFRVLVQHPRNDLGNVWFDVEDMHGNVTRVRSEEIDIV